MSTQVYAKILGQAAPAITTPTTLYTVPALRQADIATVVICNPTGTDALIDVWAIKSGEIAAAKNLIYNQTVFPAGESLASTVHFRLAQGDRLVVQTDTATVSFCAFGVEEFVQPV